jgi:hypothetical protein
MAPPDPPRPKQPSRPELPISVDKVVGAAGKHAGSQEYVRPELARRGTLPGGMAALPGPPPLPLEGAKTIPAENPLRKKTWRVPTPPSAVAQARRTPVPPSPDPSPSTDAPESTPGNSTAELAALRAKLAEFERRERVQAETASPNSYPPKVVERKPSPAAGTRVEAASSPPDAAIGRSVRWLLGKAWPFLVAAAGLGGGAVGVAKPSADPAKQDATLAEMHAMRADMAVMRDQLASMARWQATEAMYTVCLEDALDDVGEQVLPAQDRMTNATPLRAYIKQRCRRLRP